MSGVVSNLVQLLLPHLARLLWTRSSARVHRCGFAPERARQRLSNLAIGGQETLIHLQVTRFICANATCAKKTFKVGASSDHQGLAFWCVE
jgi:hypothetical protein